MIISFFMIFFAFNCTGMHHIQGPIIEFKSEPVFTAIPEIPVVPQNTQNFFLENGLEVFAVHNSASPMVCLNMTVKVGSSVEEYPTSGMSHMLEHLLFNGTETRTQEELYDLTDFYGAYSNAYTQQYFTDFILLLPQEYLEEGMDIQSDMLFHSILPEKKLEKERGIVIEEIRKDRDRESTIVQDVFDRMNYGSSGIGLPVIGTISTIEHMSREDILEFYHHYYVPNNMVLTVIGNFNPSTLKSDLEKWYGDEAAGNLHSNNNENPLLSSYSKPPMPGNFIDQVVMDISQLYGQLRFESVQSPVSSITFQKAKIAGARAKLVMQMITEWMQEDLSEALPSYHPSVSQPVDLRNPGDVIIDFQAEPNKDISNVISEITDAVSQFSGRLPEKLTEKRINAWLKNKRVEETAYLDQPHYFGMMKAGELATSGGEGMILASQILSTLTPDDVGNSTHGLYWKLTKINIVLPTGGNQKSDENNSELIYEKSILPSGATLITATGGGSEMMGMHILIKNRSRLEGELAGGAEVLHSMLDSGTDMYSRDELTTKLNAMGATTKFIDLGFIPYDDYYNSPEYGYVRLECLDADAVDAIHLLVHMMDHTTLTDEKVSSALEDAQNRLMMQRSTARETARTEFNKLFLGENNPSVGRVSGSMESIGKMTTASLTNLRNRYFKPENYIITISSRLPHDLYKNLFNSLWTGSGEPVQKNEYSLSTDLAVHNKTIDMGKEQAQILVGYKFEVEKEDLSKLSLISNILSDRMAFDLRETQGLAYALGINMGNEGNIGWITGYIGTGTENIDTALNGMRHYFLPTALDDLTQNEIQKTINAGKGAYLRRNLTRIGQAFYMGYYEYFLDDYTRAGKRYKDLDGITPDDLEIVANKYFTGSESGLTLIVK
ncbi:MAG: M16 family metallopeptidase [Fidelibacterota bacterium]